jgi:hypothetical protein
MNKIQQFIVDNNLDLYTEGSRNINYVILCGYACYIGINNINQLTDELEQNDAHYVIDMDELELSRVFDYALSRNYKSFWEKPEAHTMYKFDDINEVIPVK